MTPHPRPSAASQAWAASPGPARFVLFDLDNTLIDRQRAYRRWARAFAADRGLGDEAVRVLCDADDDGFARREAVFEAARQKLNVAGSVEELIREYRARYPDFFEPDPVVTAALERLRSSDFRVAIVTNGPPSQREKLRRAGLESLVDGVCISEEFGAEKPDPRIFAEAIRRCGGPLGAADAGWMVGDSARHDIGGGRSSRLRTIWLSRGRAWTEKDFAPDFTASNVAEAVDIVLGATVAP